MSPIKDSDDRPKLIARPVYVTGMPLCWRGCNGQYSPLFDRAGNFINAWMCDRQHYWGITLRSVVLKYDVDTQKWAFVADGGLDEDETVFASRSCPQLSHPRLVTWPQGICVSHAKPWFWQTL